MYYQVGYMCGHVIDDGDVLVSRHGRVVVEHRGKMTRKVRGTGSIILEPYNSYKGAPITLKYCNALTSYSCSYEIFIWESSRYRIET